MRTFSFTMLLLLVLATLGLAESEYATPRATLDRYLKACSDGDYAAAEACYTKSSRELVKEQMKDAEVRDPDLLKSAYDRLSPLEYREERVNEKRAILWPSDEKIPPFLLRVQDEKEGWRLDYHFMSHYIRVNEDGWSWTNSRIFKIWKSRS